MPISTTATWLSIAEGFQAKANFSYYNGVLDDQEIRITKPEHSGSMFYN